MGGACVGALEFAAAQGRQLASVVCHARTLQCAAQRVVTAVGRAWCAAIATAGSGQRVAVQPAV